MSRIGKLPIAIPSSVTVSCENNIFAVKGKLGNLECEVSSLVNLKIENNEIMVSPVDVEDRSSRSMWGTTQRLITNMIIGVNEGFEKKLEIKGTGYRAELKGKSLLRLSLGYSHPILLSYPHEKITIQCPVQTEVIIKGADKQLVGQIAAEIRKLRKPEPYKGKGIKYSNEKIRKKEGKKK